MLERVKSPIQLTEIKSYFADNYYAAPYLYVNVIKYGLGTENIFTWMDRNNENKIEGIYQLYYDCIHFFTNDIISYPVEILLNFLKENDHKVIFLNENIGKQIEDKLLNNYSYAINYIMNLDHVGNGEISENSCEIGKREDIPQIADLLMSDREFYTVYDHKVLLRQLFDRFDSNFSRFFIIRNNNTIIASCSTKGEIDNFAILGGYIVHPDYRRQGLAEKIVNFACHTLENEGKNRVSFVNSMNVKSLSLHKKMGADVVSTIAKYVRKS